MEWLQFWKLYQQEILLQSGHHFMLSLWALSLAVVAGVALGILLAKVQGLATPVLLVLGMIQTLPSLALLGFLLPFLGLGIVPALVALFLYALLPIVRNTYTGIVGIAPPIIEAALAMGMPPAKRLWQVELPLAAPVIFGGIRTAAVINVGVATLCALIAAGGLGEFIFRGIALNNAAMIWSGAVPAALMALAFDLVLGVLEKFARTIFKAFLLSLCGVAIGFTLWKLTPSLAAKTPKIGMDAEFKSRADGWQALKKHYSLGEFQAVELDAGLMYQALAQDQVELIGGYSTDGRIAAYNLQVLEDDKHFFPPYEACPLVSRKTLAKFPDLNSVFERIAGKIPDSVMQRLNYEVDKLQHNPREVAQRFLAGLQLNTQIVREGKPDLVIGGKKFTEQYILAEIFKCLIENYTPYTVGLKGGLGGTQIAFEALLHGEIDLYPEYIGTGLLVLLNTPPEVYQPILHQRQQVSRLVADQCLQRFDLVWLPALGFSNSYAVMMKKDRAKALKISKISDLIKYPKN
ncbi:MAG TPA: ABC transporter permease [Microscillaceae bacterium]|jgi:osmoprotectant transport system permease protein|nr:ABC transporter permease [Microscillaceae bacterium]